MEELDALKEEASQLHKTLESLLEKGRQNTKELLTKELNDFFAVNEPPTLKKNVDPEKKKEALKTIVLKIMYSLKFPSVKLFLSEFGLHELFFDLTWNDFKDSDLIDQFILKRVMSGDDIQQIVKLRKVFDIKR